MVAGVAILTRPRSCLMIFPTTDEDSYNRMMCLWATALVEVREEHKDDLICLELDNFPLIRVGRHAHYSNTIDLTHRLPLI